MEVYIMDFIIAWYIVAFILYFVTKYFTQQATMRKDFNEYEDISIYDNDDEYDNEDTLTRQTIWTKSGFTTSINHGFLGDYYVDENYESHSLYGGDYFLQDDENHTYAKVGDDWIEM